MQLCTIEVAKGYSAVEWREDLKRILKRAGLEGRDCVFLLSDTQITKEGFLEDINNLLNAGARAAGPAALAVSCLLGFCCVFRHAPAMAPDGVFVATVRARRRRRAKPDGA